MYVPPKRVLPQASDGDRRGHTALRASTQISRHPLKMECRQLDTCSAVAVEVHLLPALVQHNGPAAVQAYFRPTETGEGGLQALMATNLLFEVISQRCFVTCLCRLTCAAGATVDGLPMLQCSLRGRYLAGVCRRCAAGARWSAAGRTAALV